MSQKIRVLWRRRTSKELALKVSVTISGNSTKEYTLSSDRLIVSLPALVSQEEEVTIEIIYLLK
jgi:Fe-S cluster assembly iron-binding protein IscA